MRSQVELRYGKLLLVACLLLIATGQAKRLSCDVGDNISDCQQNYFTREPIVKGCPNITYCYRRADEDCNVYQTESRCANGLECLCGKCLGCDDDFNCSTDLFCPSSVSNVWKRLPYPPSKRIPPRMPRRFPNRWPVRPPIRVSWFPPRWLEMQDSFQPTST
ncbi:hypothetical protein KR018_003468 [Drosophila ironensis]|nr:hypothetical protein KR018_003468 [Drosophila ironensis]